MKVELSVSEVECLASLMADRVAILESDPVVAKDAVCAVRDARELFQKLSDYEEGFGAQHEPEPEDALASHRELWDAINAYAATCGGDTSAATAGEPRARAVAAVCRAFALAADPLEIFGERVLRIMRGRAWPDHPDGRDAGALELARAVTVAAHELRLLNWDPQPARELCLLGVAHENVPASVIEQMPDLVVDGPTRRYRVSYIARVMEAVMVEARSVQEAAQLVIDGRADSCPETLECLDVEPESVEVEEPEDEDQEDEEDPVDEEAPILSERPHQVAIDPSPDWAVCDTCGRRALERGNGLANRCEPCRVNLEDFAGRTLEILRATKAGDRAHAAILILAAANELYVLSGAPAQSRHARLAQLGARVLQEVLQMRRNCTSSLSDLHAQSARSGCALVIEDAARSLGLLDEEVRNEAPPLDGGPTSVTDRDRDIAQDARATGAWPSAPDRGREDFPDTERERGMGL